MDPSHRSWERMRLDEVRRTLATRFDVGLSHDEVMRRFTLYGPNALPRAREHGILSKVLRQFRSPLVFVLLAAGLVTLGLREYVDSIVIFLALLINVVVGTLQEERASKAFDKLNASQEKRAIVFRDGARVNCRADELVPGDIVLLEGGNIIPADVRIVEAKELRVNEAVLTGEWLAVEKSPDMVTQTVPIAEQVNMAWMGTIIESGYGRGVVVATGAKTQVGALARELGTMESETTPLQNNLQRVARFLSYMIVTALSVIFVLGVLRGESVGEMLLMSIAVAVATIPTGLPAAVSVVLALGMEAILKHGGLVRNLLAAETLGATTVILTDKTGTLTEARFKLAALYTAEAVARGRYDLSGDNRALLELAVTASDAYIEESVTAPQELIVHGRPIEKAIVLAGLEAGVVQGQLLAEAKRIDYLQFSSVRRFAASLHAPKHAALHQLIVMGEPETVLSCASTYRNAAREEKLDESMRKRFLKVLEVSASEGKRLIGVGYRYTHDQSIGTNEENVDRRLLEGLVFAGFVAFEDPVRHDVAAAISEVKHAGAQVIMLTGDNPETAKYVAMKTGIIMPGDELVIRGAEIDNWTDDELYGQLQSVRVISRALPAHKLRIVRILKNNKEVVAMTGDGVNDAPALRSASIGVAVGSGTEVAKEASDLILIDNSFSVIVRAVEEGRRIVDNLKKVVAYLLSTSYSELCLIGAALIVGAPLPLLPAQILWANIVEEGLMSFSFAFEGKDPHIMKRDPRSLQSRRIMTRELRSLIFVVSIVTGSILIAVYFWLLAQGLPIEEIRTVMFVALSLDAIFFTFSLKSFDTPVWRINIFSNKYLLVAFATSLAFLFAALSVPILRHFLSLTVLTPGEQLLLLVIGVSNLITIEVMKYIFFGRSFSKHTANVAV